MKILGFIPARSGSKGVKNKNIALINNIPLIEYTFKQIEKVRKKNLVIISSDCKKIEKITKKYKDFYFLNRPKILSQDTSAKIDVIKHLIKFVKKYFSRNYKTLIDLDPTSPLRSTKDINQSIKFFQNQKNCDTLISGYLTNRNPYFNLVIKDKKENIRLCINSPRTYTSRQKSPQVFALNSSIYIYDIEKLLLRTKVISNKTLLYEMPQDRSLDIDSKFDLKVVRKLIEKK